MKNFLNKFSYLTHHILDQIVGAEQPKLYFKQQGMFGELLNTLPRLKSKYIPTPWLANSHLHIFYFDVIKKRRMILNMI